MIELFTDIYDENKDADDPTNFLVAFGESEARYMGSVVNKLKSSYVFTSYITRKRYLTIRTKAYKIFDFTKESPQPSSFSSLVFTNTFRPTKMHFIS
nr:hypothetical protein [Tanacetum cinerariifolium]